MEFNRIPISLPGVALNMPIYHNEHLGPGSLSLATGRLSGQGPWSPQLA